MCQISIQTCLFSLIGQRSLQCSALLYACTECAGQAAGACHLAALVSAAAVQARDLSSDAQRLPASLGGICAQAALAQIPAAGTVGHQTGVFTHVLVTFAALLQDISCVSVTVS